MIHVSGVGVLFIKVGSTWLMIKYVNHLRFPPILLKLGMKYLWNMRDINCKCLDSWSIGGQDKN
jgi:hypothetical protein